MMDKPLLEKTAKSRRKISLPLTLLILLTSCVLLATLSTYVEHPVTGSEVGAKGSNKNLESAGKKETCLSFVKRCLAGKVVVNEIQACPITGCTQACCEDPNGGGAASSTASQSMQTLQRQGGLRKMPSAELRKATGRPIVVISDIGRDIDDTLAMAALSGFVKDGKASPVGFVATGGGETQVQGRIGLLRWWVSRLNMGDPLITGCVSGGNVNELRLPKGAAPDRSFVDDQCVTAAQMIIELSETYPGELEIFAIAGLGALKTALEQTDGTLNIKTVWMQGQWLQKDGRIEPEFQSYNLKIDEDSSKVVFEQLQDRVPFKLLGKWTAYQTQVTVDDFIELNEADPSSDILETALHQLDMFRKAAPFVMWYLYPGTFNDNVQHALGNPGAKPLPMKIEDAVKLLGKQYPTDEDWCDYLTYLSMPYDPNLILWGFSDAELFAPETSTVGKIVHQVVGNVAASPGVVDAAKAKSALVDVIKRGLSGATQTPDDGSKNDPPVCPKITQRAQVRRSSQPAGTSAATASTATPGKKTESKGES